MQHNHHRQRLSLFLLSTTPLHSYLSKGEILLVDEDLAVSMETYGSLVCDVEERLMRGTLTLDERRRLLALRDTVQDNVLFPYPQQDHLDGLNRQCGARVSKRRNDPIDTFHQWCYTNHPPATNDSIPASQLFALRDSYIAYLKGVQVAAALDPELTLSLSHPGRRHYHREFKRMLKSGRAFSADRADEEGEYDEETGRTKPPRRVRISFTDLVKIESGLQDVEWDELQPRQAPSFRYHAHHGVTLPHPSAVKLLKDRVDNGRRLGRVRTMLSLGCGSGVLPMMLTKGGVGLHRTVLTDPVANNVSSAAANMAQLGKRSAVTTESEMLASATMPATFVRTKVRDGNVASADARIDGEYAQEDEDEEEDDGAGGAGTRAGSAVCLQTEQSLFPTQEETPDEGFQLVLYATPHAGEAPGFGAVDEPAARSYEQERGALEEILHKADAYMVCRQHAHPTPLQKKAKKNRRSTAASWSSPTRTAKTSRAAATLSATCCSRRRKPSRSRPRTPSSPTSMRPSTTSSTTPPRARTSPQAASAAPPSPTPAGGAVAGTTRCPWASASPAPWRTSRKTCRPAPSGRT